ncbi:hypothetical protein MMC29_003410 [Sticta canariensis]|nr:hypothetical protein [Sticta canariensis]
MSLGGKLIPHPGFPVSAAFSNALQLVNYLTTTSGATNDAVFKKYFNPEPKQIVKDVFNCLLGDDCVSGAAAFAKIKVVAGADEPGDSYPAVLEGFDNPKPILVLRQNAWVYPDRDDNPDACNTWEDQGMSQDMYLLGSVLLHEYTQVIDQDNGRGWQNARALDKNVAKYNADSYGWHATELFWAVICAKDGGYDALPDVKRGPNRSSLHILQTVF